MLNRCNSLAQLSADLELRQNELDAANAAIAAASVDGHEPDQTTLDATAFCPEGLALIDKAGSAYRDQRAAKPNVVFSLAAEVTETKHDYLELTTAPDVYTSRSVTDAAGGGALRLMYRFDESGQFGRVVNTIEVPALLAFGKQPSSTTAKWCTAAGSVMGMDGSLTPAMTCNERALGAPKNISTIRGALLLGFESKDSSSYRWSAGVTATIQKQDHGKPGYAAGLTFPLYLSTNLAADDKGVFKGIVRVTPSFLWTRDLSGVTDSIFAITIELLTGRSLYPAAADLL